VCGAYEAISAGKPLVLSNTKALRNYFGDFATYVNNDASSICAGIETILQNYKEYSSTAKSNSINVEDNWLQLFSNLQKLLQ
jgi:glycosyltransferase involved in cell wall biosynthesis